MSDKFNQLSVEAKKNIVCLVVLAILGMVVALCAWWNYRPAPAVVYSKELTGSSVIESHILTVGDVYWGREMREWAKESSLPDVEYPFSQLHEFQPELYDAWIGNLECPSVPGVDATFQEEKEQLKFNCPVEYLPEAAKWFDIFSLANNHTQNQGRETGLQQTREQLDKYGIQHFGNFNPHVKSDVCEVVALPVRIKQDSGQKEAVLPVAMCGFHGVYYTITDKSIAVMREYAKYMPVFAFPHMGEEYQAVTDEKRQQIYRKMIDNGADVVLGNHPHWVQPTEVYNGKLIVYSQGNFIFDQQFSSEVTRSAAIDITMRLAGGAVSADDLEQWTKLGAGCRGYKDVCLEQARNRQLKRLPVDFSYDVVSVDLADKITKRASLKMHELVLERMRWHETKVQLQSSDTR